MQVRRSIEKVTRDWKLDRHMPLDFGRAPIRVSTSGGLRFLFRPMEQVDPCLLRMARELVRPGMTVWDVGANVGLFSVASSQLSGESGRVFAIEADAWLVRLLRDTAGMQPKSGAPIEIVPAAVADRVGLARFCVAERSRSSNYLEGHGQSQAGGVRETQTVVTLSLDWLMEEIPVPQVVKIDVEGAEGRVLRGAQQLLSNVRPSVLCEVSSESADEVTEILLGHGYQLFDGELPQAERRPLSRAVWTTVAIPPGG